MRLSGEQSIECTESYRKKKKAIGRHLAALALDVILDPHDRSKAKLIWETEWNWSLHLTFYLITHEIQTSSSNLSLNNHNSAVDIESNILWINKTSDQTCNHDFGL